MILLATLFRAIAINLASIFRYLVTKATTAQNNGYRWDTYFRTNITILFICPIFTHFLDH